MKAKVPRYDKLIEPTFNALIELGGSGSNAEILDKIIESLDLKDEVVDTLHNGSDTMTEIQYQAMWARTYLKKYGAIDSCGRALWAINPKFNKDLSPLDSKTVTNTVKMLCGEKSNEGKTHKKPIEPTEDEGIDTPEEAQTWRTRLSEVLHSMDPYGFERLAQRILRECGFSQVVVTKKSGDGGIDGTGKLKINGIFSFNVAFQCKRYSGIVGAGAIRDFRGSLTTDIEKGVFITTGTFSKSAREEAANPGKQQIDLIDGEELMNKIAEYGIGVKEVKTYEVDEEFFKKI